MVSAAVRRTRQTGRVVTDARGHTHGVRTRCFHALRRDSDRLLREHLDFGPSPAGSYANTTKSINKSIDSLGWLTSNYDVSVPSSGAYNTSYDIWDNHHQYEIMLWVNYNGPVGPIGTYQANVTLGGHNWNVFKGTNGSNQVFSFLRTTDSNSGTVDVKPVLNWIAYTKGWMPGNEVIGDVQFGYEITSSSGGLDFNTNNLTVGGG